MIKSVNVDDTGLIIVKANDGVYFRYGANDWMYMVDSTDKAVADLDTELRMEQELRTYLRNQEEKDYS